ncbi:bile acid:sodium symporter family protein [Denitromonas iodatirespirans]|uniref:Bile acid:sodium symporter family protein n=1 Tax=Denitromonas iodatirespirans TaxID=2795389 RepID=A0A944HFH8_DENI1|nr:bile acid:sodium symporter family protein [Denitromonas iodatirespirans]MBT0963731.1 bile acid:sodium symporter family protein [Denitromonas iodatirespirans]
MIKLLLPLGLAFIMFSLGLGLRLADFRRVLRRPDALALGLLAQVVLLPTTAWLIATGLSLAPEAAVGLMILAACPGGVTAGMVTHLARGETALSISLTALTSMVAFISVPLIVGGSLLLFMGDTSTVRLPVGQTAGGLFLITLLPVGLGLWLNETGRIGARHAALVHRVATGLFLLIVLFTFASQWPAMARHFPSVGPAALLLNLLTMATGAALGALVRLDGAGRVALAMECGMQNSALGITLAVSLLGAPALAVPAVIYAFLMNITAFAVIAVRRARHATAHG